MRHLDTPADFAAVAGAGFGRVFGARVFAFFDDHLTGNAAEADAR